MQEVFGYVVPDSRRGKQGVTAGTPRVLDGHGTCRVISINTTHNRNARLEQVLRGRIIHQTVVGIATTTHHGESGPLYNTFGVSVTRLGPLLLLLFLHGLTEGTH